MKILAWSMKGCLVHDSSLNTDNLHFQRIWPCYIRDDTAPFYKRFYILHYEKKNPDLRKLMGEIANCDFQVNSIEHHLSLVLLSQMTLACRLADPLCVNSRKLVISLTVSTQDGRQQQLLSPYRNQYNTVIIMYSRTGMKLHALITFNLVPVATSVFTKVPCIL